MNLSPLLIGDTVIMSRSKRLTLGLSIKLNMVGELGCSALVDDSNCRHFQK